MNKQDLDNLRHSCAHLLAAAVLDLYPDSLRTIGPSIENGFYFDFDNLKISDADLPTIEAKMHEIASTWKDFQGREVTPQEAKDLYPGNVYKHELIDEFSGEGQKLTVYKSGDYEDLCRGGHCEHPDRELKHFKLMSTAGAYWRGSEKNKMLTRIYGTIFPTKDELNHYLWQQDESEKRDNRKIGRELELFTISPQVGPGLILWLPKGNIIREEVEKLGKETEDKYGYQRVSTPHIGKEELYTTSGHLPYYAQDMWPAMEYENAKYYVKPMNCPHMHMIYKFKQRTYKELPIRYAEFGTVYRHEDSGTLLGLLRVRGHTTNDAHIYLTEDQVEKEIADVMQMHTDYYKLFGITDYYVELALPDFEKKSDKYIENREAWDKSIAILRTAAKKLNIQVVEKAGGAAFYGPKFDFNIKSAIGREFGASTNQLDFSSSERFKLTYIDKDGTEKLVPYILHRAPLGSLERFTGFLIEHYAGAFPTWLSPVQVAVLPISDKQLDYAQKVASELKAAKVRVELNDKNEPLNARIRDAGNQKVPYIVVVGDKEVESGSVSVRKRGQQNSIVSSLAEFTSEVKNAIITRSSE